MPYDYVSKLDPAVRKKAQDELGETEQRLQQSCDIIREWLKKQPHLAKCEIGELVAVLYSLRRLITRLELV